MRRVRTIHLVGRRKKDAYETEPSINQIALASSRWRGCAGTQENAMTAAANPVALAQDYPAKLVRIIEPFGAGGGPDLLARALGGDQQLAVAPDPGRTSSNRLWCSHL